ncbi:hypothetical protein SAMN04488074_11621 [Lentzea albidocapillata subsp. violacea]|uniref:Membrane protein involved in the export of O-antigen and teichoic acid n=1 Tax=Lentzea albidocapillata subsp. violacea TaxID=128104 RepID=A0A1G9Q456_9PSEU|nr:hypothetical protein [Lentzea albidocapillata]SDM05766.1 hypothetical protein SAMN04488074_11621 [Lentzea albidocapillata subsp. violacea]
MSSAQFTGSKVALGRKFAVSGSKLALAIFITGMKGLIFFHTLSAYEPTVVAAYATALNLIMVFVIAAGGFQMLVVSRFRPADFRPDTWRPETADRLSALAATAVAVLVGLAALLALAGGALALMTSGSALVETAYWARVPSVWLVPITSMLSGILVLMGKEGVALRVAVENLVLTIAVAFVLTFFDLSGPAILVCIGLFGTAVDLSLVLRQWIGLGPMRGAAGAALRRGVRLISAPGRWQYVKAVPRAVSGAVDALLLAATFTVVTALATTVSPVAGAITGSLVALIRTVVVPLKAYGMVAGRMTKQSENAATMNTFVTTVGLFFIPAGLFLLVSPATFVNLVGEYPADSPGILLAVRLVGAQLVLEPFTGFVSSALKVLVAPSATLRSLAISLFGCALPAISVLSWTGSLSLGGVWIVLLLTRVLFCVQTTYTYSRWRSRALEAAG